ncbi:Hsp20/alpha crystallin family protein [Candidatus Parcubacteria bacterium]|nr:Hsp20/alpha crystallin family protein [Candidatus Parcubacteria bacterium]
MAIMRWQPFRDFDRFFDEDFVPMIPFGRMHGPAVDVSETETEVAVEMAVPGTEREKMDITVENNVLTVSAKHEEEKEEHGKQFYRKEIRRGAFERSVALPAEVKGEEAKATVDKGILKVVLPKSERAKPKKVQIEVK